MTADITIHRVQKVTSEQHTLDVEGRTSHIKTFTFTDDKGVKTELTLFSETAEALKIMRGKR